MSDSPSNGANGRQANGRFAKGWAGGPGNPHAKRVSEIRAALMSAVDPADIKAAVKKVVAAAKRGDLRALSELLDRTIGNPTPGDLAERIERLEAILLEREAQHGQDHPQQNH